MFLRLKFLKSVPRVLAPSPCCAEGPLTSTLVPSDSEGIVVVLAW